MFIKSCTSCSALFVAPGSRKSCPEDIGYGHGTIDHFGFRGLADTGSQTDYFVIVRHLRRRTLLRHFAGLPGAGIKQEHILVKRPTADDWQLLYPPVVA